MIVNLQYSSRTYSACAVFKNIAVQQTCSSSVQTASVMLIATVRQVIVVIVLKTYILINSTISERIP
jgi:hypothetical protein